MTIHKNNKNEIIFKDGNWVYPDDIPTKSAWNGRCSGDGQNSYKDKDGKWRWSDNHELCSIGKPKPCGKCGQYPTSDGNDSCLGHLGKVTNACCGHGDSEGYIQFDNGITIRGYFRIENDKNGSEIDNAIKTEIFKCRFCGQIYNATDCRTRCGTCGKDFRCNTDEINDFGIEYFSTNTSKT